MDGIGICADFIAGVAFADGVLLNALVVHGVDVVPKQRKGFAFAAEIGSDGRHERSVTVGFQLGEIVGVEVTKLVRDKQLSPRNDKRFDGVVEGANELGLGVGLGRVYPKQVGVLRVVDGFVVVGQRRLRGAGNSFDKRIGGGRFQTIERCVGKVCRCP